MKLKTTMNVALVAATLAAAAPAQAYAALADEADINAGLLAVGIADEIRKKCDSISGRVIKGQLYLLEMANLAKSRGYSDAEIKAYVKSDVEKARMRAKGNAYLKSKGVIASDPQTYCTVGMAEIASKSQIGAFLKAK